MGSRMSMEAVGKVIEKLTAARICLLITSIIQIIASLLAIIGWGIMLGEDHGQHSNGSSDIHTGTGVWAGAIVLAAGILGLLAAMPVLSLCSRAGLMYANFGCSMAIWGTAFQVIQRGLNIHSDSQAPHRPPASHWDDAGTIESIALMEVIMGAIFYATAISVVSTYAAFHVRLSKDRQCAAGGPTEKQMA